MIVAEEGKTFSGHATINVSVDPSDNVVASVVCNMPNGSVLLFEKEVVTEDANFDFACTELHLTVINFDDEDQFVTISGVVQYQTSTNVSTELP